MPTKGLPLADVVRPWAVALAAFCSCDCFSFERALLNTVQRERLSKYKYHADGNNGFMPCGEMGCEGMKVREGNTSTLFKLFFSRAYWCGVTSHVYGKRGGGTYWSVV